MTKRLSILLVALLAFVFAVAAVGCGDDDEGGDSGSKENTPAETESAAGGGDAKEEDSGGGGSTSVPDSPQKDEAIKQAKESCQKAFDAQPQISADTKKKAADICEEVAEKTADGDTKAAGEGAVEICRLIAKELPAQARGAAEDACDQQEKAIQ